MKIALTELQELLAVLDKAGVAEFEYQDDGYSFRVARAVATGLALAAPVTAQPTVAPATTTAAEPDGNFAFVTSPFVGTFYRASSPNSAEFAPVGSKVKKGQTLCIVEAMKLMNEIESELSGTVVECLVENGRNVEYGQRLFKLRPE